jgi:cell division protein FtsN
VIAFTKRQDWRALTRFRPEPVTALVVSVILGGAISVALYGRGKSNANSAQTAYTSSTPHSPLSSSAIGQGTVSELAQTEASYVPRVITSHDVDLRRDSGVELVNIQSPAAKSMNDVLGFEPTKRPVVPSQASRAVKKKQTPSRPVEQKTPSNAEVSAQMQTLTSSAQPQTLLSADISQPASSEAATKPPQPDSAPPNPALEKAGPVSVQKTTDSAAKTATVFIEVGSFKDETWAISAQEKLTQLGFHAVLIHKTLLWAQSFHVQVGPYTDPKEIEEARQSLSSHGFKSHLVN